MAWRGRGRGRGRGSSSFGYSKQVPFELFPEIALPNVNDVVIEKNLVMLNSRLQNYWRSSPYYLEITIAKEKENIDRERYCDWGKRKTPVKRDSLTQILQLHPQNFPKELIGGYKEAPTKKVRWNPDAELKRLDMYEEAEQKAQGQEDKPENEEDEDDDAEVDDAESEEDEDYIQIVEFDDDEDDDYNVNDDNNDAGEGGFY